MNLFDEMKRVEEISQDGWVEITLRMPESFIKIFEDTIEQYKALTGSDRTFPALEAMIIEARNSLPSEGAKEDVE